MHDVYNNAQSRGTQTVWRPKTHRGDVTRPDVVLSLQSRSQLELQLLLMFAGVHELLVTTLQL